MNSFHLFLIFPSLCVYVSLSLLEKSLFTATKIYDMLMLNLKPLKHSENTPLSAYHLNFDTNYSQWPCLS